MPETPMMPAPVFSRWRFTAGVVLLALGWICPLFILGGNFWDKLRALFIYDARVCFPEKTAA